MEYKGSFIKTILLLFLVLAIVTVINGRPAGSSKEVLQRDDGKDGDEVPADQSYKTAPEIAIIQERPSGRPEATEETAKIIHGMPSVSHEGGCKKSHFVHLRPLVYCKKCLVIAPEIAKMVQPGSDVIQQRPSKRPEASQVANFEVAQLDGEKDFVERHHEVLQRSGMDCLGCYCGELKDCCFDPLGLKGWDECLCCCCCKSRG